MDALERLTAIEEIKQLKARYLIALDKKDWDGYAGVFTPDGLLDLDVEKEYHRGRAIDPGPDGPPWVANGREEIHDFIAAAHAESVSVHEAHTPIIEVDGEEAKGTWGFHDWIVFSDGSGFRGYGHYHDTYRVVAGEWKIASMALSRIRLDWADDAREI